MNIKRLLTISRPLAWTWTIGAYLVGMGSFSNFTSLSLIEFLFMFFPINFVIYGLNDIYDRKSDKINPNKDDFQGAKVKDNEIKIIKNLSIMLSVAFIILAVISKNIQHIILSSSLILLAYIYSGPPLRLKSKPIIDSFFGSVGYLIPVLLAFTTYNSLSNLPLVYALLVFPLMAGHAIFTLRDRKYDEKTGTKTIGVYLGERKTLIFAVIMYLIPLIFLNNIFLKAVFLTSALSTVSVLVTGLKKEKYIIPLASCVFFSINLTFIYFILSANLG